MTNKLQEKAQKSKFQAIDTTNERKLISFDRTINSAVRSFL